MSDAGDFNPITGKADGWEAALEPGSPEAIMAGMSEVDGRFFCAVLSLLDLYELVDVDRDLIREEMGVVLARWSDVVGEEIARLDDPQAIEAGLAELFGAH